MRRTIRATVTVLLGLGFGGWMVGRLGLGLYGCQKGYVTMGQSANRVYESLAHGEIVCKKSYTHP